MVFVPTGPRKPRSLGRSVASPSPANREGSLMVLVLEISARGSYEVDSMGTGCTDAGFLGRPTMVDDYYLEKCATTARQNPRWHR